MQPFGLRHRRLPCGGANDEKHVWLLLGFGKKGYGPTGKETQRGWESAEEGRPKLLDLSSRLLWRTGVIYCYIGTCSFAIQGFLGALTGVKTLLSPTSGHCPGQPRLARRLNIYAPLAHFVPTGLEQKRGIQNRDLHAALVEGFGLLVEQTTDFRMSQLFQIVPFLLCLVPLAEDDAGQLGPVDPAIRSEDRVSPALSCGRLDLRQTQRLMSRPICIEHAGPQRLELPGRQALSAGNSTGNADDLHPLVASG
jgi:hypothetical protein